MVPRRARRRQALTALLVMMVPLLGSSVAFGHGPAAESWLESRYDSARSGRTPTWGPPLNETAFTIDLGSPRGMAATPIIIERNAYVLTENLGQWPHFGYNDSGLNALWRLNLDTGHAAALFEHARSGFAVDAGTLASDGRYLYLVATGRIEAYDTRTDTGPTVVWERPQSTQGPEWGWLCNPATIAAGILYIGCIEAAGHQDENTGGVTPTSLQSFLAAVTLSGLEPAEEVWSRVIPPTRPHGAQEPGAPAETDPCGTLDDASNDVTYALCPSYPLILGHSVIGDLVVAPLASGAVLDILLPGLVEPSNEAAFVEGALAAFAATDGSLRWTRHHPAPEAAEDAREHADDPEYRSWDRVLKAEVTGAAEYIFSREPELVWLDATDGGRIGADPKQVSDGDLTGTALAPGFALDGAELYVSSEQHLHRFDWLTREYTGRTLAPLTSGEFFQLPDMIVTDSSLYAKTAVLRQNDASEGWGRFHSESNHIVAYDTQSQHIHPKWRHAFGGGYSPNILWLAHGISQGLLVAHGMDGNVTVIGRTEASLQPPAMPAAQWPGTGQEVHLDLSGALPGTGGPPSEYRVEWGDGNVTRWQASPRFTHTYGAAGDQTATAWMRNQAGQTAGTQIVMHVGQAAPGSCNLVCQAFQPDRQEFTFFLLGLLVTLLIALLGVWNVRRRRRLLQHEIQTIERGVRHHKHDPEAAEDFLKTRHDIADDLFASRRLTAEEHTVLIHRLQNAMALVRLGELDEQLAFLPYGLVREMREALADGRLLPAEHERLTHLVRADKELTKKQKERAMERIDAWRMRDARPNTSQ